MTDTFNDEIALYLRYLNKLIKRTEKNLTAAEEELLQAQRWPEKYHEAELLQSNLYLHKKGMSELKVQDWAEEGKEVIIPLLPRISIQDQLKLRFQNVKKLKKTIPHFERKVSELSATLQNQRQLVNQLEAITDEQVWFELKSKLPPIPSPKIKTAYPKKIAPRLPYQEYLSASGIPIWVGRTAKDNDLLTFKHTRGNDWWMHAADVPGSHVVIRSEHPDEETLLDAMTLAMAFSRLKEEHKGEITLTQCKYLAKPRGAKPGLVTVSQHKKRLIQYDPERMKAIKRRSSQATHLP